MPPWRIDGCPGWMGARPRSRQGSPRASIHERPVQVPGAIEVERTLAQVQALESGGGEVGVGEVGAGDVGAPQIGAAKLAADKAGALEARVPQRGELQDGARQVGAVEAGAV